MASDLYSLTEEGKKVSSPIELFITLEGRKPNNGEFISCYCHSEVMGKAFLTTYDFKETK